jgi:hypothetical protein
MNTPEARRAAERAAGGIGATADDRRALDRRAGNTFGTTAAERRAMARGGQVRASLEAAAPVIGHATHYGDGSWRAAGDGWTVTGNGSRAEMVAALERHGYKLTHWRSVSGVAYDGPDGPVYSDMARVMDGRTCTSCGPVSLDLSDYAQCSGCGRFMFHAAG